MGERDELDASITGTPGRRSRWQLIAAPLLVALGVSYGVWKGDWFFVLYGSWASGAVVLSYRPPTVVSADGIRRPWRRPNQVPWTDVAVVLAPQPGLSRPQLQLTNGKKVTLDDILSFRTATVAAIGGKDVVRPASPTVVPAPPRFPPPRSDQEVLADVTRQAAALARQREELAAQSRRLRP